MWLDKYQEGGKVSKDGYKKTSKDKHEPFLNIPSENISMKGVRSPILAIADTGMSQFMVPPYDYYFPGATVVREFPLGKMQKGGSIRGTKLSGAQEKAYQQWRNTLPTNLQYEGDYDLRGFYKDNPTWTPNTPGQHMTDRYKLPNHPTFSNESMYYSPANKDSAGYWQDNMYIPYNPAIKDTVREFKDGGITYTGTNRPADKVHYTPQQAPVYSVGEQYMMEHPQQYMRSAEGYGTPQQQRDHEYLRNKMYQQEAGERANREFAQKMKPGSELADKILTADMMLSGAGVVNKGLRGISKKVAKKLADDVVPYSGNFPAAYTKGTRGNTPMPTITEVPQMTKEQQILQSFGLNPYGQKTPYTEDEAIDAINASWMRMVNKTPKKEQYMFATKGPSKKGEVFEQGYTKNPWIEGEKAFGSYGEAGIERDPSMLKYEYPELYTDFGPKTPMQRMINEERGRKDQIPNDLIPKVRQQNKYGGKVNGWLSKY